MIQCILHTVKSSKITLDKIFAVGMNLTLVTEITDSIIDKAFEKIQKIHWGGWTNEDFLLGLGNVDLG